MGSITVTRDGPPRAVGNRLMAFGTLSPSSSYASGGESFTASMFALGRVERLVVFPSPGGYVAGVDMANGTVKIFGQEPTNATTGVIALSEISGDKSAQQFPFIAIGFK